MSLNVFGECFLTELDKKINGYVLSSGFRNKFTFISYNDLYFSGDIKQYEVIISMRIALPQSTNWNTFRLVKTDNLGLYFISSDGDFNAYNIFLMRLPILEGKTVETSIEENNNYKPEFTPIPGNIDKGTNGMPDTITLDPRIQYNTTPQTILDVERNTDIGSSNQTVLGFKLGLGKDGEKGTSQFFSSNEYYSSEWAIKWTEKQKRFGNYLTLPITYNIPNTSITPEKNRYFNLKIWFNYPEYLYQPYAEQQQLKPPSGINITPILSTIQGGVLKPIINHQNNNSNIKELTQRANYFPNYDLISSNFMNITYYDNEEYNINNLNDNLYVSFGELKQGENVIQLQQIENAEVLISYELYSYEY